MSVPFVDLRALHRPLQAELAQAMQAVLERGDFVLGQDVTLFEEEFAAYCGMSYGVGVSSGLAALELILRAFGIGPGDEVIIPAHTFVATASAVTSSGARPVLVDVDPQTFNIDPARIEAMITPRTRAIMPVHLYGLPADMDPIMQLAAKHNLVVVEDASQAHGATYKQRRTGSLGHAAAFSLYPTKNLGAAGDAGIVVTNNPQVAEQVRAMRNCGQKAKNVHELAPLNYRLDTLQAALLRIKLRHLDEWNQARRQVAALYREALDGSGYVLPVEPAGSEHVYHLFVIRTPDRDELRSYLQTQGIGTAIHYPLPVHRQPYYMQQADRIRYAELPNSERLCDEIVSLPMFPDMTAAQVQEVADRLGEFVRVSLS